MLVGRARKPDAAKLAHRAARTIAAAHPRGRDRASGAVRLLQRCADPARVLLETGELGIPLDGQAPFGQLVAHDPLVVVLAKDEDERIGGQGATGLAQWHARHLAPLRPYVRARAAFAELERAFHEAELRIDLQRARLHAERPRLARRARVPVDDERAHATAAELVGEHQAGWAGADDQDVGVHLVRRRAGSNHGTERRRLERSTGRVSLP